LNWYDQVFSSCSLKGVRARRDEFVYSRRDCHIYEVLNGTVVEWMEEVSGEKYRA
jgi:hypothetical protein